MPVCDSGSVAGRGCRNAVVGVAASCSDSVRPPSCILARPAQCEFAPQHQKTGLCLFVITKCGGAGCRNAVVWVAASLQRLCSTAIVHPCTTRKLRVLAPAAPKIIPRLLSGVLFLVPMAGVEPARYCYQRILSPSRLPIPSHRLIIMCRKTALHNGNNDFTV